MDAIDLRKKAEDIFDVSAEGTASIVANMFLDGIAGAVVPGAFTIILSYKQKRAEKMLERFMFETKQRILELEENLKDKSENELREFKEKYFGLITDYVVDEAQEEKIKLLVTGFINLAGMRDITEDFVFLYFDILKDLRMIDIYVLKISYAFFNSFDNNNFNPEEYRNKIAELNISEEQLSTINEKLENLGLFNSEKNSRIDDLYNCVNKIKRYYDDIRLIGKANMGILSLSNRPSTYHHLSPFGRKFMKFFIENNK